MNAAGNNINIINSGARLNFIPQYAKAPSAPNMNIATGIAFMLIFTLDIAAVRFQPQCGQKTALLAKAVF